MYLSRLSEVPNENITYRQRWLRLDFVIIGMLVLIFYSPF